MIACLAAGGGYVAWAATRDGSGDDAPARRGGSPTATADPRGPTVVFQHVARDGEYARIALVRPGEPRRRAFTALTCERVHVAAGRGLCLVGRQGLTGPTYKALIFDARFEVRHERTVPGLLSRARISPDGRYGATTGFVSGHSYAEPGEFSTLTTIIDMARGRVVADLEDFTAMRDGQRVRAADRNFWGVTFARDSDRFYATMRSGERTWLVEGSVRGRSLRTLHENVECPSLSPDGTRVAYKKRVEEGDVIWRLYVLDLRTMKETRLAESRLVDDQPEWLDDGTVLYGRVDGRVWAQRADGRGSPRLFLDNALSPAVIAPAA
ncbi:MAG TPA: hypothetical protein VGV67_06420 [Solirubrobacteraceae bacterium]|nr:hypothetical protein [Solirubrobacteraceae bacterium]